MKIRHKIIISKVGRVARCETLLEHLRYSHSILEEWEDDGEKLEAICLYRGTRRGFEMIKDRAYSFIGVEIKKE